MTKVVFRKWRDEQIIALFPDEPWSGAGYDVVSYMQIGQHGSADYEGVIASSSPATEPEYRDLLAELHSIGYNDLRIIQRAHPKLMINNQKPKFGISDHTLTFSKKKG